MASESTAIAPYVYTGPAGNACSTHVYVVEFGGAGIKVGRTIRPTVRLRAHHQAGRSFGHPVRQAWVSDPHQEAVANERALIDHCLSAGGARRGAEYFDYDFSAAVQFAQSLPMTWAENDAAPDRIARHLANAVRCERIRGGLSQAELADLMGCSRQTVNKIEAGERAVLAHELVTLCSVLDATMDVLLMKADQRDRRILGL